MKIVGGTMSIIGGTMNTINRSIIGGTMSSSYGTNNVLMVPPTMLNKLGPILECLFNSSHVFFPDVKW